MLRDAVWRDIRHGCRVLARNPGFTTVALLTLTIGIGATTAVFSFVDAVLLKPLPYESGDRIVRLLERSPTGDSTWVSTPSFLDWEAQSTVFEHLAAQQQGLATLTDGNELQTLRVLRVSADYFDVFGVKARLGRTFVAGEDVEGNQHVVVLSYPLWRDRFGGDPGIVGQTVNLDDEPYTVVGVLAENEAFNRSQTEIWHPLALPPVGASREYRWLSSTFGLLRPGVSLSQARAEMNAIGSRIAAAYPDSNRGWGVAVDSYADLIVGAPLRASLLALMAAVGGLLLICCANLTSLVLARTVSRGGELAIRATLGATRMRVVQQFLGECLVLAAAGSALGIGLGVAGVFAFRKMLPPGTLPSEAVVQLDFRVLAFAVAVSAVSSILFGLAPVVRATGASFKSNTHGQQRGATANRGLRKTFNAIVAAEVAIAVFLLFCSTLLIRSFVGLVNVDPGFDAGNALTMRLPVPGFPPGSYYSDPSEFQSYMREIVDGARSLPEARDAAISSALPLTDCCLYSLNMQIEGRPAPDRANRGRGMFKVVTPSYFSALRLTLTSGRFLDEQDTAATRPVIVVNERLANRYFPGADPIGQRLLNPEIIPGKTERGGDIAWEIVGVVADESTSSLDDETSAVAYASYEQSPVYFANLIVTSDLDAKLLERPVRELLRRINPGQSILDVRTMSEIKAASVGSERLQSVLLGAFSATALVLAAIGMFGVLAYSVVRRRREIGIRAAVGASPAHLLRMILRQGATVATAGLVLGLLLAYGVSPLLGPILYHVEPHDPYLMAGVAGAFMIVAALACAIPATWASRLDPNAVLRGD